MPDPEGVALKELWLNRLNDARLRLDFARDYAIEIRRDFSSGDISAPVERVEMTEAIRVETMALTEYSRILRLYVDLVLRGKVPPQPRHATAGD